MSFLIKYANSYQDTLDRFSDTKTLDKRENPGSASDKVRAQKNRGKRSLQDYTKKPVINMAPLYTSFTGPLNVTPGKFNQNTKGRYYHLGNHMLGQGASQGFYFDPKTRQYKNTGNIPVGGYASDKLFANDKGRFIDLIENDKGKDQLELVNPSVAKAKFVENMAASGGLLGERYRRYMWGEDAPVSLQPTTPPQIPNQVQYIPTPQDLDSTSTRPSNSLPVLQ